uniref:Uncharacterized protein n=1 Tax=Ciona savignyi TaxID=51511 RepID=H2Z191_CIOSA
MTSCKAPLQVLENPENNQIHEYGKPVLKSLKPRMVKKTATNQTSKKWVSPDKHFSTCENQAPQTKSIPTNSVKQSKQCNTAKSICAIPSRERFTELNCAKFTAPVNLDDDDKENMPPGGTRNYKKVSSTKTSSPKTLSKRTRSSTLKQQNSEIGRLRFNR